VVPVDDDFHLQLTSAAIDAASAGANELGIVGTSLADSQGDEGIVYLGFHYSVGSPARQPQP
jgi:hypothetical protein